MKAFPLYSNTGPRLKPFLVGFLLCWPGCKMPDKSWWGWEMSQSNTGCPCVRCWGTVLCLYLPVHRPSKAELREMNDAGGMGGCFAPYTTNWVCCNECAPSAILRMSMRALTLSYARQHKRSSGWAKGKKSGSGILHRSSRKGRSLSKGHSFPPLL